MDKKTSLIAVERVIFIFFFSLYSHATLKEFWGRNINTKKKDVHSLIYVMPKQTK